MNIGPFISFCKQNIQKYNKIVKFIAGGTFITVLQVVLLYIFVHVFQIWYLYSSQLSFFIVFIVSFFIYKDWVFSSGAKSGTHKFVLYSSLTLLNFFMNGLFMYFFVSFLGIWYIFSQIVVKVLISILNYFVYNSLIFNK
jgi:putative flippase GtrA